MFSMKLYGNNRYKKSYLVKKAPEFSNKNIEKETIIFEIKNESEVVNLNLNLKW